MKPSDESIERLRERVRVLTGEREAAKRILEAAVDSLVFPVVVDETFSSDVLLVQAAQKLRSFIKLDALVFYLFSADGLDFFPAFCDPPEKISFFEEEMVPLVDDGTFAWAIDRNKPVIITARPGKVSADTDAKERQLLLHSIISSNRSIGMFMGLLGEDETAILDVSFAFFTVLLGSMASILQNAELYTMIQGLNNELQGKIERLEESERNLAEAMKAKEVFLANVSHEVRTPLNGIVGMTTLLEETFLDTRQRELLGVLKDESGALLRLINDLLDFSKMEAGKLVFEDTPFDLYELWSSVRDSFLPRAVAKNLSFSMTLEESTPRVVSGDSFRIRQVLGNLVGNAVKFTPAGFVEITGKCSERREEFFLFKVKVHDTGIGISTEKVDDLFQPFVQGDVSMTRKYGGTGLGLAISKRIVDGMGGWISLESREGEGSIFSFTIPMREVRVHEGPLPQSFREKETREDAFATSSILVVEDNPTNRTVAVALLHLLGLQNIETAENGEEAIEKLAVTRYDLVFMDIQMPLLDGLQALAIIRDPSSKVTDHEIPVVAMTANALPGERERYIEAGMSDYISKPILAAELRRIVRRFLSGEIPDSPGSESFLHSAINTHKPVASEHPPFRPAVLLERMGDDRELCRKTIALFIEDSAKILEKIGDATASGDAKESRRMIHALRGASANVEAFALALLAATAEQAAERGDLEEVGRVLPKIERAREEFIQVFRDFDTSVSGGT